LVALTVTFLATVFAATFFTVALFTPFLAAFFATTLGLRTDFERTGACFAFLAFAGERLVRADRAAFLAVVLRPAAFLARAGVFFAARAAFRLAIALILSER
jgi:hypothetical protein